MAFSILSSRGPFIELPLFLASLDGVRLRMHWLLTLRGPWLSKVVQNGKANEWKICRDWCKAAWKTRRCTTRTWKHWTRKALRRSAKKHIFHSYGQWEIQDIWNLTASRIMCGFHPLRAYHCQYSQRAAMCTASSPFIKQCKNCATAARPDRGKYR